MRFCGGACNPSAPSCHSTHSMPAAAVITSSQTWDASVSSLFQPSLKCNKNSVDLRFSGTHAPALITGSCDCSHHHTNACSLVHPRASTMPAWLSPSWLRAPARRWLGCSSHGRAHSSLAATGTGQQLTHPVVFHEDFRINPIPAGHRCIPLLQFNLSEGGLRLPPTSPTSPSPAHTPCRGAAGPPTRSCSGNRT